MINLTDPYINQALGDDVKACSHEADKIGDDLILLALTDDLYQIEQAIKAWRQKLTEKSIALPKLTYPKIHCEILSWLKKFKDLESKMRKHHFSGEDLMRVVVVNDSMKKILVRLKREGLSSE